MIIKRITANRFGGARELGLELGLELGRMNILIGPNGAGKSSILSVISHSPAYAEQFVQS